MGELIKDEESNNIMDFVPHFSENKMNKVDIFFKKFKIKFLLKYNKVSYKYCEIDNNNFSLK